MKYYVLADIHSFFTETKAALEAAGYFTEPQPHKLILCGDIFDRGREALATQAFVLEEMEKNAVILLRGNHEDLILKLLEDWDWLSYTAIAHHTNGTIGTVKQLLQIDEDMFDYAPERVERRLRNTPYLRKIIPVMRDYFETRHYIFVHGWIPCKMIRILNRPAQYEPIENWRTADESVWKEARWRNGMEAAKNGILVPGKIIVCGHFHCSFGHAVYENKGSEYGADADFSPYRAEGILAIDACTAASRRVNCIVIEDEDG